MTAVVMLGPGMSEDKGLCNNLRITIWAASKDNNLGLLGVAKRSNKPSGK
jgi:hypothetical protein